MTPAATVVVTTRDRRELLAKSLDALQRQTVPCRLVVADDASSDGTAEMLATQFPDVVHLRSEVPVGPAAQRNRGVERAGTDVVILVDDDTVLPSPRTVEQTLADFSDPRIGAVAMPFVNVLQDAVVRTRAPDLDRVYVGHAFVAAAHAVRRADFRAVGGYRECLFYMGEEGDLCLRLLAAGKVTRWGTADPAEHYQPAGRVSWAADVYGRRNDVLVPALTAPLAVLPGVLGGTTVNGLRYGARCRRPARMAWGLARGYWAAARRLGDRRPVPTAAWRLFRQLKRDEPVPLHAVAGDLGLIGGGT